MSPLSQIDNNAPRRRHKKVKLMGESGQTDADRRELRSKYRELQQDIAANAEKMENVKENAFSKLRGENNALYEQVKYTREAVLDGENVEMITSRAVRQVDKLVQVPRYDPVRLTDKLIQLCSKRTGSSSVFDWNTLGNEAGACFNAIPSRVVFLAGPLAADYQPKERKKRAPRKKQQEEEDQEEEEEPEEQKVKEKRNANQLSAVERSIRVLGKTLSKKCHKHMVAKKELLLQQEFESPQERKRAEKMLSKTGYDIDAIQYLFNPDSFTQTVENMFYFSFLIKKGDARISVSEDGGPTVRAVTDRKTATPDKQAVVAFTMKDWRELCRAHSVKTGDLPNRGQKREREEE